MGFVIVIPARYDSTRLPGKPLREIAGKPMIQHVYERASDSGADAVYIATDDARIVDAARTFTDRVYLTDAGHQSGTDRTEEVVTRLALPDDTVVVNVQGDEPMIPPALIDQVAQDLVAHPEAGMSSLYEPLKDLEELRNPNIVKVVVDEQGYALYFSRSPLPWQDALQDDETGTTVAARRHIGIYAYRTSVLHQFVAWQQTGLERSERLEQLRALGQGVRIHMTACQVPAPAGVDTIEDLQRAEQALSRPAGEVQ